MREIKFRAWDKKNKRIATAFFIGSLSGLPFLVVKNTPTEIMHIVSEFILMQYTGLKDKNKKEIYYGDIVLVTPVGWIDKEHECESCRQYKIEVKDVLDGMKKEIRCQPFFHSYREVEIIGNIYENKELLN